MDESGGGVACHFGDGADDKTQAIDVKYPPGNGYIYNISQLGTIILTKIPWVGIC